MDVTICFLLVIVVAPLGNCQVFNVTTETPLEVCDLESLPVSFSVMCMVDPAAVLLWEVTGVSPPLQSAIARGETVRSFTYPNVIGQAVLNVNDPSRMDVRNQTCFICRADYPSGAISRSDAVCVDVVGPPSPPSNVMTTGNTVAWTPSAPGLSHRISVCRKGTSDCAYETRCTGCISIGITGIEAHGNYTIKVCSFRLANGVPCEGCALPVTEELNTTGTSSPMLSCAKGPVGVTSGVLAGVAVGCLALSLLTTVATGVITFLCTRRCYQKSSPPSPNEKSVCYETVQSDSVQMQPSPAYQSVEQVK